MKHQSIFFKLNLLFATALIVTLVAGALLLRQTAIRERASLMLKSRVVMQELRRNHRLSRALLKSLDLRKVPEDQAAAILRRARSAGPHGRRLRGLRDLRPYSRQLLYDRGRRYLLIRTPGRELLLLSRKSRVELYLLPGVLFLAILLLLSFSYWTLRRSLGPMRRLEEEIRRYGEGKSLKYRNRFRGEDEISTIARAFYDSADRLRRYGEARRLFLRNLFHELNTPVTKGKLLAELSEEPRTRRMLSSIFERLSTLLGELVEVERIASGSEPFGERTRIRLGEIVNEACRRLYCEGEIPIEIPQNRTLTADREAMVIVAKNLLDNARKYGADPRVYLEGDRLVFSSEGPRLEHPLEHYTEPFRQEYGAERSPGFGLGLYIVKEILERHGMELHYRHEEGRNLFTVGPVTGL